MAATVRLCRAFGRLLRSMHLIPKPDFRIEMGRHELRGRAGLYLSFAKAGNLDLDRSTLYSIAREVPFWDLVRISTLSGAGRAATRFSDRADTGPSITIGYDYYSDPDPSVLYAAYPMHPHYYRTGIYRRLPRLRQSSRPIRIFFAGTSNARYHNEFRFPMMPRTEVIDTILQAFPGECFLVRSRSDLDSARTGKKPIVLVLTDETADSVQKHLLRPAEYLEFLSLSWSALCPPGLVMPHSHNLIEALAVGCAPILEYAPYCRPPLTPGKNCLAYNNPENLRAVVRNCLEMPVSDLAELSTGAADYYDAFCSIDGWAARLKEAMAAGCNQMLINDEQHWRLNTIAR